MEIYVDSAIRDIVLNVPVNPISSTMDIELYKNEEMIYEFPNVLSQGPGKFKVVLPYAYVQQDAEYVVNWRFDYTENNQTFQFNKEVSVSVVTPYITLEEMREMFTEEGKATTGTTKTAGQKLAVKYQSWKPLQRMIAEMKSSD